MALETVDLFPFTHIFLFFNWRLITLQYCSGFCHTLTWISHGCTCVSHPEPPSHLPPYPYTLAKLYSIVEKAQSKISYSPLFLWKLFVFWLFLRRLWASEDRQVLCFACPFKPNLLASVNGPGNRWRCPGDGRSHLGFLQSTPIPSVPIPKKGNAKECSNYCTIAFISHASKVMLKILQARLQQ